MLEIWLNSACAVSRKALAKVELGGIASLAPESWVAAVWDTAVLREKRLVKSRAVSVYLGDTRLRMLAIVTWFAVVEEVAKELEMEADASDPKLALVVAVVVVVVVAVVVAVVVVEEEVESVTAAEGEPLVGKKFLMEVWRFEVVR